MATVLIVIHLMVVLAMIGVVLLQRSEGGALGIGGGGGGFMTRRGAGNLLTRATAFLAAAFFATSIALTILTRLESRPADILDSLPGGAPVTAPAGGTAPLAPPTSGQDVLDQLRQRSGLPATPAGPQGGVQQPAPPAPPTGSQ